MNAAMGIEAVKQRLLAACLEEGLFENEAVPAIWKKDLIDAGAIDSMGLLALEGILETEFGASVPHEIMVAELRTLEKLALYLHAKAAGAP